MRPARPAAFSLIELMISTALALAMLSLATTAFFRFRAISERAETRLAIHTSAQRLYTQLQRTFACVQPSCAFVVRTTAGSEIRLVFMRAKEHNWDFMIPSNTSVVNPDLVWEEWVWTRADGTLRNAASSAGTASSPGRSFSSGSFSPAGVNYSGQTFRTTPQPRRTLDTADPFHAANGGLDDNMLFPAGPYPAGNSMLSSSPPFAAWKGSAVSSVRLGWGVVLKVCPE
jgi:type II secretory pathway pseudopilin PulG